MFTSVFVMVFAYILFRIIAYLIKKKNNRFHVWIGALYFAEVSLLASIFLLRILHLSLSIAIPISLVFGAIGYFIYKKNNPPADELDEMIAEIGEKEDDNALKMK